MPALSTCSWMISSCDDRRERSVDDISGSRDVVVGGRGLTRSPATPSFSLRTAIRPSSSRYSLTASYSSVSDGSDQNSSGVSEKQKGREGGREGSSVSYARRKNIGYAEERPVAGQKR